MADQHIPAGFGRITMGYTRSPDPEEMLNVFGVDTAATPELTMEGVREAYFDALADQVASGIVLTTIQLEVGSASGAPPYLTFEINPNQAGLAANYDQPPPNTAILIKKATGAAGRQGRGRLYWPVVGDSFANNIGTLDTAVRADLQTAWDLFFDNLVENSVPMVLLHGASQPITLPSPVTTLTVDGKVATQRRRLRP